MPRRSGRGRRNSGPITIEIQGLERLRDQLEGLTTTIRAAAFKALKESAQEIVKDTKANVRVDSGNLQEGVAARYRNNELYAEVGWWQNDDRYAPFHEHGTRRIPAKPSLGPAFEAERRKIGDRIAAEVRKVLP